MEQPHLEEKYEKLVYRVSEHNTISRMVSMMEQNLPFTFVNNFAGCAFMAAVIVKRKYPDSVKIISVIHNDNMRLRKRTSVLASNGASSRKPGSPIKYCRYGFSAICSTSSRSEN